MSNTVYTDETLMPFGKHKGTKLANVPATYLLWLYNSGAPSPQLLAYIEDNMEILQKEVSKPKKPNRYGNYC